MLSDDGTLVGALVSCTEMVLTLELMDPQGIEAAIGTCLDEGVLS